MTAILSESVDVDDDVAGFLWSVSDLDELAKLIAIIALGQAEHAARIIRELEPHGPALSDVELYAGARGQLRIRGETVAQQEVSQYHRDGFLFECISWIAARQAANERTFMKDPHITATTQGLDGLMIEMDASEPVVLRATIFEDKCTENPRKKFKQEVMRTFAEYHEGKRSRELVANAVSLIKEGGLNGTAATRAAARILDKNYRIYRAALTVSSSIDSSARRKKLFQGFNCLGDITQAQRVGAVFVTDVALRDWFQALADLVIAILNEFEASYV
jgi:hypothetical protein